MVLGAVVVVDFFGDNENLTNPVDSLIFLSLVGDNDRSLFGEMGVRIDDLGLVGVLGAKKDANCCCCCWRGCIVNKLLSSNNSWKIERIIIEIFVLFYFLFSIFFFSVLAIFF